MDNINSTNSSNLDENVENVSESENAEEENDKGDRNDDDMVCLSVEASKEKPYKSLTNNVELKFKRKSNRQGNLIVITGVNGVGKTHFLERIARDEKYKTQYRPDVLLTTRSSKEERTLELTVEKIERLIKKINYSEKCISTLKSIDDEMQDLLKKIHSGEEANILERTIREMRDRLEEIYDVRKMKSDPTLNSIILEMRDFIEKIRNREKAYTLELTVEKLKKLLKKGIDENQIDSSRLELIQQDFQDLLEKIHSGKNITSELTVKKIEDLLKDAFLSAWENKYSGNKDGDYRRCLFDEKSQEYRYKTIFLAYCLLVITKIAYLCSDYEVLKRLGEPFATYNQNDIYFDSLFSSEHIPLFNKIAEKLGLPEFNKLEKEWSSCVTFDFTPKEIPKFLNGACKDIKIVVEDESNENKDKNENKFIEDKFTCYIEELLIERILRQSGSIIDVVKHVINTARMRVVRLIDAKISENDANLFKYNFDRIFSKNEKIFIPVFLPRNKRAELKAKGKAIRFEDLSSGEKMIFELICYATFCEMLNIKYLLFDEFDANLNPQLAESYIKTVREVLLKSGITVVLTTHSPSTVIEVEPDELWWMSRMRRDDGSEEVELKSAENKGGKVKILDFLAPRFTPSEDAAKLTYSAIPNGSIVIFVEGESDLAFFEAVNEKMESISKKNRYHFCYLGGITRASYITFMLQNFPNNLKKIIFMLDSDNAGCEAIVNFLENKIKDQDFKKKFVTENNIFLTLIQSSDGDTGEYKLEEMIKDIMEETSRNGSSPLKCNFILLLLKEKWKMMKIMKVINILVLSNKSSSKDGVELIKDIINYSCDELKGAYESKVSSLKGCDIENWNELIQDCKEEDKEKLEKAGKELVGFIGAIVKHLNEVIDYFGQLNGDSKDISAATSNRKKINWKEIEGTINTSCVGTINNIIANLEEIKNDKKGKQLEGNTEKWDEAIELIKIVANGTTSELNKEVMKTIIPSDPMTSEPVKRQFDWINSIIEYSEGKQEKFGKEVKISKKGRNVKIVTRKQS